MSVAFSLIPSDAKIPLFYAEVSSSKALPVSGVQWGPSLVIGQGLGSGFASGVPIRIYSTAQIDQLCRPGSMIARMVKAYRNNDAYGELWALPLADNGTTYATTTINFVGAATAAGVLSLYIAGKKLAIPVTVGMTAAQLATACQNALGTNETAAAALGSEYPVTATASTAALAITARNAGTVGNGISVWLNYGGAAAGEALPAGITITEFASVKYVYLSTGATDPSLSTLATMLAAKRWSFVAHPYHDVTPTTGALALFKAEWADSSTGRWGPTRRYYGHTFSAKVDTDSGLGGLTLLNDPHASIFGIEGSPTWHAEYAAMYAAVAAASARAHAARPLNTLQLVGALPPHAEDVWDYTTRKTIMDLGFTIAMPSTSDVRISRAITTYIKNAFGAADPAYLDVTTLFNLDFQLTGMESLITTTYPRHILVSDTAQVGPGQPATSPSAIRNLLIGQYKAWERMAIVENADLFAAALVVERDGTDPNRVNVLWSPDLANGLHIFALLAEFRLSY